MPFFEPFELQTTSDRLVVNVGKTSEKCYYHW